MDFLHKDMTPADWEAIRQAQRIADAVAERIAPTKTPEIPDDQRAWFDRMGRYYEERRKARNATKATAPSRSAAEELADLRKARRGSR